MIKVKYLNRKAPGSFCLPSLHRVLILNSSCWLEFFYKCRVKDVSFLHSLSNNSFITKRPKFLLEGSLLSAKTGNSAMSSFCICIEGTAEITYIINNLVMWKKILLAKNPSYIHYKKIKSIKSQN